MKFTKLCVRCLTSKAKTWSGHVVDKKEKSIIAGWCEACGKIEGFVGHYKHKMGKK